MNAKVYSGPVEVPICEMTHGRVIDEAKVVFYHDVRKRLEQTKAGFAVRYEFSDAREAADYQRFVSQRGRKEFGRAAIRSGKRRSQDDSLWHVYFSRGPNWKK